MKLLFGLSIIVFVIFLTSCNQPPNLTKPEVYKILNEIIADDSLRLYSICQNAEHLAISDEFNFSIRDKNFMEQQNKIFKDFKFESKQLKFFSIKKKIYDFVDIDTTCNAGIVNRLSFPLISADRRKVVIENTEDCHCMLGGQSSKDVYIKENGHWKKEKSVDHWISQGTEIDISNKMLAAFYCR